jgi:hypothetical protein
LPDLLRDVVALFAVAARHRPHELSAVVQERDADAVDLGLDDQRQRATRGELELLSATLQPLLELLRDRHRGALAVAPIGRELLEREHRHGVRDLREALGMVVARPRVGPLLARDTELVRELRVAVDHVVEHTVADLRLARPIRLLVVAYLRLELGQLLAPALLIGARHRHARSSVEARPRACERRIDQP